MARATSCRASTRAFRIETYRDRIDKPHSYSKLGVVAAEDDVGALLGHTSIQAVTRLRIPLD